MVKKELLESLYIEQRKTTQDIADELGYSAMGIYLMLKKHNIPTRKRGNIKGKYKATEETKDKMRVNAKRGEDNPQWKGGRKAVERRAREKYKKEHGVYYSQHYYQKKAGDIKAERQELKKDVFNHYGWVCKCCGEDNPFFLTIDHINNDGAEHRRNIKKTLYKWIIENNFPNDLQTLCMNCNWAKARFGECPHQNKEKKAFKVIGV